MQKAGDLDENALRGLRCAIRRLRGVLAAVLLQIGVELLQVIALACGIYGCIYQWRMVSGVRPVG